MESDRFINPQELLAIFLPTLSTWSPHVSLSSILSPRNLAQLILLI